MKEEGRMATREEKREIEEEKNALHYFRSDRRNKETTDQRKP